MRLTILQLERLHELTRLLHGDISFWFIADPIYQRIQSLEMVIEGEGDMYEITYLWQNNNWIKQ